MEWGCSQGGGHGIVCGVRGRGAGYVVVGWGWWMDTQMNGEGFSERYLALMAGEATINSGDTNTSRLVRCSDTRMKPLLRRNVLQHGHRFGTE